jgi:hypothetical protein
MPVMVDEQGQPVPPKPVEVKPEPKPLPADQLAAKVKAAVEDLHAEEMEKRDAAVDALRALGRQAAALVVEAAKKETDLEAKEQLLGVLVGWRVYDAMPELLTRKVNAFLKEWQDVAAKNAGRGWGSGLVEWYYLDQPVESSFPYGLEPYYVNWHLVEAMSHRDVLEIPAGVAEIAHTVKTGKHDVAVQRLLATLLAYYDCSKAEEAVLAAHGAAADAQTRVWLQIALGWLPGAKAREALLAGLKDSNGWIRRASFIGLERTKDASVIPSLLELLKDANHETRWNAAFTLRYLTDGKVAVNVYRPADEVKAQVSAAEEWWKRSADTFRITK